MSLNAIFKDIEGEERFVGYSTLDYSSNDDEETVVETSESELNGLIPSSVSADSWKNVREKYVLEGGEIGFDEDYTRPDPTSGGS